MSEFITPSLIGALSKCAYQVLLSRTLGRRPPSTAMLRGTAVHGAVEALWAMRHKTTDRAKDIATALFDEAVNAGGVWVPPGNPVQATIDAARDEAAAIAANIVPVLDSLPPPKRVERLIEVAVGHVLFRGRIDWHTDVSIVDVKTGSSLWSQDRADKEPQMTAYALLGQTANIIAPDENGALRIQILSATPKKAVVLETRRTTTDIDRYRAVILAADRQLQAGIFPPNLEGWIHSPAYCEYWYDCPFGGGDPENAYIWR